MSMSNHRIICRPVVATYLSNSRKPNLRALKVNLIILISRGILNIHTYLHFLLRSYYDCDESINNPQGQRNLNRVLKQTNFITQVWFRLILSLFWCIETSEFLFKWFPVYQDLCIITSSFFSYLGFPAQFIRIN